LPPTLTKNEIDALMNALQEGKVDLPPEGPAESSVDAQPYDFTKRDRLVRGSLPVLDTINYRLAFRLARALSELAQQEITVVAEPAAPMKLGEFLSYQPEPGCINIIGIAPLLGSGLLCIQPNVFFLLLNLIFGGQQASGQPEIMARGFTPIELELARLLVESWAESAAAAWEPVLTLKPTYLHTEVSAQQVTIGATSDLVMSNSFLVRIGELEGKFDLAIPYLSLEPVRSKLSEHSTEQSRQDRERWQRELEQALLEVPLKVCVHLGSCRISLRRLLDCQVGDLLVLDSHPQKWQELYIAGKPKGQVSPLQANGSLAFRFEQWRENEPAE